MLPVRGALRLEVLYREDAHERKLACVGKLLEGR